MFKRVFVTASVRLLGVPAQLLLMLAITRLTGAFEAGVYYFAFALLVILASMSRLGSELSGLREVASHLTRNSGTALRRAVRVRALVTIAVSVTLATGLALAVPLLVGAAPSAPDAAIVILILALALPALALLGLFVEVLKAIDRAGFAVFMQNVTVPVATVILLSLASLSGWTDARATAVATTVSIWSALGVAFGVWWRWVQHWSPTAQDTTTGTGVRQLLRDAPALLVVASASTVMQWMGLAILGVMATPEQVAGFGVAVRLAIAGAVVNSAITSVMSPKMAAAHATGDLPKMARLAHTSAALILAATAPILLILGAFPQLWLSVFGADFPAFATELRVLLLGQLLAAFLGHSGSVLVMAGRYRDARLTAVVAVLALGGLMLALIPAFGTLGAAMAMSGAVVVGHLTAVALVRRNPGFWPIPLRLRDLTGNRTGRR